METIITDLKVKLSTGKELSLTAQEARELHAELKKLFQLAPSDPYYPVSPVTPSWPVVPIIVEQPCPKWPNYWEVTYGTPDQQPMCGISNTTLFIGGNR